MAHVKGRRYILYIGVCFDHSIFIEQLETGLQIPGNTELTDVATYHTKFSACIIGQDATLAFGKFGSNVSRKLVVKLCRRQVLQVDIINREVWTPAMFAIIEPFYSGFQFEAGVFRVLTKAVKPNVTQSWKPSRRESPIVYFQIP